MVRVWGVYGSMELKKELGWARGWNSVVNLGKKEEEVRIICKWRFGRWRERERKLLLM